MSNSCPAPIKSKYRTRSVKEALQSAYDLLGTKKHWVQGSMAVASKKRDEDGDLVDEVSVKDPRAIAFCALGALLHVNGPYQEKAKKLLQKAATFTLNESEDPSYVSSDEDIFAVNDDFGYGAVRKMFRLAIKWAGQKNRL